MADQRPKLVIIGLDGATYDLILPWAGEGRLPNFARLLSGGVWGELESTKPPLTCPAWPAFMTGKNPGKLGIADFITGEDGAERIVSVADIAGEPFWDTAGRAGRRGVIMNVPVTWPPRIANGLLISGMMTPPGRQWCTSAEAAREIEAAVGDYIVDLDILTLNSFDKKGSRQRMYTMMERRFAAARHLMATEPWDLFLVVFKATDMVCHRLWDRQDEVRRVYETVDGYLGAFMEPGRNLFLMSDHGFAAYPKGVRVNQHLLEAGLLERREAGAEDGFTQGFTKLQRERFGSDGNLGYEAISLLNRALLKAGVSREGIKRRLRSQALKRTLGLKLPKVLKRLLPPARHAVDTTCSRAYLHSSRSRSVVINRALVGSGAEYERLCREVAEGLLSVRDPETGRPAIRGVERREAIYRGPYVERLPDLYIEAEPGYLIRGGFGEGVIEHFPVPKANHDPRGIFAGWGPDVAPGGRLEGLRIIDLAPTFLHLLGLPVPEDMDGRVALEVFRPRSEAAGRRPATCAPFAAGQTTEAGLSAEDEESVKGVLRGLGYMD
jgi:predicted AlkP superfamily phosphohydrolase/phosphomutase